MYVKIELYEPEGSDESYSARNTKQFVLIARVDLAFNEFKIR